MTMSMKKVGIIAKREYLTTVRRKAFVVTLLLTPAIFFFAGVVSTRMQISQAVAKLNESRVVAMVDSSGLFANAPLVFDYSAPVEPNFDPRQAKKPPAAPKRVPVVVRAFVPVVPPLEDIFVHVVQSGAGLDQGKSGPPTMDELDLHGAAR